ncbi:DUF6233 domain-containing protein [Streptomyces sp. NPDC003753]
MELGIGAGRPPVQAQAGNCHRAAKRRRTVNHDEARHLLATGLQACSHGQSDSRLRILDSAARRAHRRLPLAAHLPDDP